MAVGGYITGYIDGVGEGEGPLMSRARPRATGARMAAVRRRRKPSALISLAFELRTEWECGWMGAVSSGRVFEGRGWGFRSGSGGRLWSIGC